MLVQIVKGVAISVLSVKWSCFSAVSRSAHWLHSLINSQVVCLSSFPKFLLFLFYDSSSIYSICTSQCSQSAQKNSTNQQENIQLFFYSLYISSFIFFMFLFLNNVKIRTKIYSVSTTGLEQKIIRKHGLKLKINFEWKLPTISLKRKTSKWNHYWDNY